MSATQSAETTVLEALSAAMQTDIGRRREENQDAGDIFDGPGFRMYVVCDGMGGVKGGAIASNLAINVIRDRIQSVPDPKEGTIIEAVRIANERIFEEGVTKTSLAGMGTTFVGLLFSGLRLYIASVGDSRAYRFRSANDIRQLTEDHTLVMELIRSGTITPEQAHNHPVSHMLTRSLGPSPEVEVDCYLCRDGPVRGDSYLLCSDGLYNLVNEEEMAAIVLANEPTVAVSALVSLANERGGTDNITVVIVKVGDNYPISLEDLPEVASSSVRSVEDVLPLAARASVGSIAQTASSSAGSNGALLGIESQYATETPSNDMPATVQSPEEEFARNPKLESKISLNESEQLRRGGFDSSLENQDQLASRQHCDLSNQSSINYSATNDGGYGDKTINAQATRLQVEHRSGVSSVANISMVATVVAMFFLVIWVISKPTEESNLTSSNVHLNESQRMSSAPESVKHTTNSETESFNVDNQADNTRVAYDANSIEALGQSQKQQIHRRRELLRARLTDIVEKVNSFDKPLSGSAGKTLADSASKLLEYQKSLDDVRGRIDIATRKLTVWYGRRKRLQETDPVNLANEVSVSSDEVRAKKEQFEKSTWSYLREAEGSIYNPKDQAQVNKVAELVKIRKLHMAELVEAIKAAIDQAASEANQHVAELTLERDSLQANLETAKLDQLYAKILLGSDQSAKSRILDQLKREQSAIQAELEGLDQLAK